MLIIDSDKDQVAESGNNGKDSASGPTQEVQTSISDKIEKEIEAEDSTEGGVNLEPREETMATVQKKPMPSRDSQRAPCYRGKPKDLVEFFEEFEEHAAAVELSNGEKATWVVKYVKSKEVASFWKYFQSKGLHEVERSNFGAVPRGRDRRALHEEGIVGADSEISTQVHENTEPSY